MVAEGNASIVCNTDFTASASVIYAGVASVSGTATITAKGVIIGDNWTPETENTNTWTPVSVNSNTWTAVSHNANTWTDVAVNDNTWTTQEYGTNTWLRQN